MRESALITDPITYGQEKFFGADGLPERALAGITAWPQAF